MAATGIRPISWDPGSCTARWSGWLWWLAVPFAAAIVLRFLSFAPGVKPLLTSSRRAVAGSFGILIVAITVIAAVTGIATMLRVNRALADASISERGDAASPNATVRAEAARLIAEGYAGLITGHTHEPELSQVGRVLRQHGMRDRGGADPEGPVRAAPAVPGGTAAVDGRVAGRDRCCRSRCRWTSGPSASPRRWSDWFWPRSGPGPRRWRSSVSLPDGATWPINERALMPWVRRRRVRRVAAFTLLIAGLLNVVFALLWPIRWTRPVDHWLPFGIHPVGGVTAVIGGLALAGVARGVRLGYRRAWVAALVLLLVSTVYRLMQDVGLEGSSIACVFGVWLLLEHRHFRVSPSGARRILGWVVMAGLVVAGLAAGLDAVCHGSRETRDVVVVAILGTAILVLVTALPGREHRRTGEARARAFVRARAIFDRYGGDTLDYFALRDDKSWLFSGQHARGLLGHQPHHAGLARPDRAGRRAPRRLVRRDGSGRRQRVVHLRPRRVRALAADLPGGRPDRRLHG